MPDGDAVDRLIRQVAMDEGAVDGCPCDLVVVGDHTGALTAWALQITAEHADAVVLSHHTSSARAHALADAHPDAIRSRRLRVAGLPGPDGTVVPASLSDALTGLSPHAVLARLPRSLRALRTIARDLARAARATGRTDLTLVAGGRVKHMTRSQNTALELGFDEVHASRGRGSARCLVASSPREDVTADAPHQHPSHVASADPELVPEFVETAQVSVTVRGTPRTIALAAVGGVFSGAKPDHGSLLMLRALDASLPEEVDPALEKDGVHLVDLGSGNGLVAAYLASTFPTALITASDDDLDAVASTRATLAALDFPERPAGRLRIDWDDALSTLEAGSADLVMLNPPFHDGPRVDPTIVHGLLDAAARVLRPGGSLWFVHNSHLRYRAEVERRVGPVTERARDRRFTVLSAERRP